jgi:hypothetical protein
MTKKTVKDVEIQEEVLPGGTITDPGFYVKCVRVAAGDAGLRYPDKNGVINLKTNVDPDLGYVAHTIATNEATPRMLIPNERGIVNNADAAPLDSDASYYLKGYMNGGIIKFALFDGVLDLFTA